MTDPIADMLTRIRNASAIRKEEVRMPHSRLKESLAEVFIASGFIGSVKRDDKGKHPELVIKLKYADDKEKVPAIRGLQRVSKPGQRIYVAKQRIPRIRQGLGVAILSTPKGLLTDRQARQRGLGGEVICTIW